jgi:hypothetical protein
MSMLSSYFVKYIPDKNSYKGFDFMNIHFLAENEEINYCSNYEIVWNSLDYGMARDRYFGLHFVDKNVQVLRHSLVWMSEYRSNTQFINTKERQHLQKQLQPWTPFMFYVYT